ncbi:MAG TPA: glycosyltransferase [Cytophagaceae bacterium]|jgi:spore maturation protein CgeB
MFYHSLLSDWNHGNAHFLRGIVTELLKRGHDVKVYEPLNGWSYSNMTSEYGDEINEDFHRYYPKLETNFYNLQSADLEAILSNSDLVIVHEWSEHELVKRVGEYKDIFNYKLLFHDTHHRVITDKESMSNYDLSNYDGVLAFGNVIRDIYLDEKRTEKAWTWHEAADTRIFYPRPNGTSAGDLVWIGNWGDDERTAELYEFLINPVKELKLKAKVYGVRYPDHAIKALADAGIEYGGWLPNYKAPEVFAQYKVTVHVPRKPYVEILRGIPTIRPFEALACGIPLISAPWKDEEKLFRSDDFLMVNNGEEMKKALTAILKDQRRAEELTVNGRQTINRKHTCIHRVNELEKICKELGIDEEKIYPNEFVHIKHLV